MMDSLQVHSRSLYQSLVFSPICRDIVSIGGICSASRLPKPSKPHRLTFEQLLFFLVTDSASVFRPRKDARELATGSECCQHFDPCRSRVEILTASHRDRQSGIYDPCPGKSNAILNSIPQAFPSQRLGKPAEATARSSRIPSHYGVEPLTWAPALLGMHRTTLLFRMQKLSISKRSPHGLLQ